MFTGQSQSKKFNGILLTLDVSLALFFATGLLVYHSVFILIMPHMISKTQVTSNKKCIDDFLKDPYMVGADTRHSNSAARLLSMTMTQKFEATSSHFWLQYSSFLSVSFKVAYFFICTRGLKWT